MPIKKIIGGGGGVINVISLDKMCTGICTGVRE